MNPISVLLPHPDPLRVRLGFAVLSDPDMLHRRHVTKVSRSLVRARLAQKGLGRRLAIRRLEGHSSWASDVALGDAQLIAGRYHTIHARLTNRPDTVAVRASEGGWTGLPCIALIVALIGAGAAWNHDLPQAAVLVFAAVALAYFVGADAGWSHGYSEASWHCVEETVYEAKEDVRAEAAQRSNWESRRMAIDLPPPPRGEGFLYVIEFSTGTVKVGQTEDPRRRLPNHRAEAAAFGVTVANYWISPPHMNRRNNETRLINRCLRVSPRRARLEYFHDVTFDTAVGFARELKYHSARAGSKSTEGAWR